MLEKTNNHKYLKIVINILIIAFMIVMPNYVLAEGNEFKKGDMNNDGNIDLSDLVVMLRHISAEKSNKNGQWLFTEKQIEAGDIIQNGKIDSSDVLALLRYMAAKKSTAVAKKHQEWLILDKTEDIEEVEDTDKTEEKEETEGIEITDNEGPKVEKIEAISKTGNYKTGSKVQIKVSFNEKIYAAPNKEAFEENTIPILNISFGEGKVKHPYVEEINNIKMDIIYQYEITDEDKGELKVNGASSFDGTKSIYDEAGNEVTLIAGKDLTGNKITANEVEETIEEETTKPEDIVEPDEEISEEENTTEPEKTPISLNKTILNLKENDGERLILSNADNQEITWSSSNTSVATVSETGFVIAKKEGTAVITAKATNGETVTCQVIVKNENIQVTGVTLNKTSLELEESEGERLIATVYPSNAVNQTITWISSNKEVAVVSQNGFIIAQKEGTATITAMTSSGHEATCQVTVKKQVIPVTSITLNKTTLSMVKGNSATLTATVKPTNATNKTVTWTSSNKNVATVTSNGKVKALKTGTTTITAKTANGITAKCKVTVREAIMSIPYIYQGDSRYASYRFPVHTGSSIPANGCGIIAVTMVLQYLTDTNVSVETVSTWADNNGHFNGVGSNASLFSAAAQKWNVGKVKTTGSIETVKEALRNGRPVISYQKAGLFTRNLHFIVLTGIDSSGKIHVNNPNGMNQGKTFSDSQIHSTNIMYWIFDEKK